MSNIPWEITCFSGTGPWTDTKTRKAVIPYKLYSWEIQLLTVHLRLLSCRVPKLDSVAYPETNQDLQNLSATNIERKLW